MHPRPNGEPAGRHVERQCVAEFPTQGRDQQIATLKVDFAGFAGVAAQLAVLKQLGDRFFKRNVALAVNCLPFPSHCRENARRGDGVAEPQSGSEHLG